MHECYCIFEYAIFDYDSKLQENQESKKPEVDKNKYKKTHK